jgi:predicted secreted protein
MKSRLLFPALVCVAVVFLASCVASIGPRIYNDPNKLIEVSVNEEFAIAVDYTATTEYFWEPQYDSDALELVENTCLLCTVGELQSAGPYVDYNYSGATDAVNFSRFKALKDGNTEVTMVFKRPNEDTFIEQKTFKVMVN